MSEAVLEAKLRTSIKNLVDALRSGENINSKRNVFITAGKAYVQAVKAAAAANVRAVNAAATPATPATPAPVASTNVKAPVTANTKTLINKLRGLITQVRRLKLMSGKEVSVKIISSLKSFFLDLPGRATSAARRLKPKSVVETSTPATSNSITTLIGNRWGEKTDLVKKYIAESYLLKPGKSTRKNQASNRAIGNKNKDPQLGEFWGMVDAKMKEKARVGIMGVNKFNNIAPTGINSYINKRPANKKAANRKALAGRFGLRTVDPNLIRFFAAVNAKTAATAAANKAAAKRAANKVAAEQAAKAEANKVAREAKAEANKVAREAAAKAAREAKAVREAEKQLQAKAVEEAKKLARSTALVAQAAQP